MHRLLKIAAREYGAYVRTVGFWLSMLLMPVVGAAAISAPAVLEHNAPPPTIAIIDQTGQAFAAPVVDGLRKSRGDGGRARIVDKTPEPDKPLNAQIRTWLVGDGALTAVAVVHGSGDAVAVDFWSNNLTDQSLERGVTGAVADVMQARRLAALGIEPMALEAAQSLSPKVTSFSPRATGGGEVAMRDRLPGIVGFAAAFLLWSMILTGAGILLNSVIEEKSNRVLEVLLASASSAEIMFGKILGVAGVTLTVLAVWASVGGTVMVLTQPTLAADVGAVLFGKGLVFYFGFYLIGGYLLYAAIFIAVGAFCETTREAQTLLGPVMALLTIPIIFMTQAIRRPDSPLLEALSWVPPFTPFLMTARAASQPPLWQVIGTGALMLATVGVVVWLAGRAFRAGALSTGKVDLKGLIARIRGAEA
jgi:ABC-2 type transport system permease protein